MGAACAVVARRDPVVRRGARIRAVRVGAGEMAATMMPWRAAARGVAGRRARGTTRGSRASAAWVVIANGARAARGGTTTEASARDGVEARASRRRARRGGRSEDEDGDWDVGGGGVHTLGSYTSGDEDDEGDVSGTYDEASTSSGRRYGAGRARAESGRAGGRGVEIVEGPRGEITTRASIDENDSVVGGSGRRSWRRDGDGGSRYGGERSSNAGARPTANGFSRSYRDLERSMLSDYDEEGGTSAAWDLNDPTWEADASVMLRAADTGDAPTAIAALERMNKLGAKNSVAVPLAFYNMTLRACKRSRPPASADATRLLREMREQGPPPDARTYHEVIAAYARAHEWKLAEQTFEEMKQAFKSLGSTWQPSVRVYTSLISAYGKCGQFEKANDLFKSVMADSRVTLDTGVYNALLSAAVNAGRYKDAVEIFERMPGDNVRRNVTTFNAMLTSLGRQRRIRDMENMFQSMQRAGIMPNETTYSGLITSHGNIGNIDRALELLHHVLIAPRLRASAVIFNSALGACVKAGSLEGTQRVLRVMKSEGVLSTLVTYNTLLMEASAERDWKRAARLYKELIVSGFAPDSITLDCLCGIEKLQACREKALQAEIERAEREGVELPVYDDRVCDISDSPLGDLPALIRALRDDAELARVPEAEGYVCDAMLRVLHVNNKHSEVEDAFKFMIQNNVPRTVHTYNSLLISYEASKEWQKAGDTMSRMLAEGITPNSLTFDALIDVCEEMGQWDRATSWLEQAQAAGHLRCEDDLGVLDLHRIRSAGTAQCVLRWWLRRMRTRALAPLDVRAAGVGTRALVSGLAGKKELPVTIRDLPEEIQVVTGWGKHSTVYGHSPVKERTLATLNRLNSPFEVPSHNIGCLVANRGAVRTWLVRDELLSLVRFLGGNRDALKRNFNPASGPQ